MKKAKWLSLIIALMVCFISAFTFSGCNTSVFDENSTVAEYSTAYVTASKNFEKMLSYDKMEASTVISTMSAVVENQHSLTYKETADAEDTVTKEFFDSTTTEKTKTVYTVRNNNEIFIIVEEVVTTKGTTHSVTAEQLLETIVEDKTENTTYELGVQIGEENVYFMRKHSVITKAGGQAETVKEYKLYQDKQAYEQGVETFAESLFGGFLTAFETVYDQDADINVLQVVSLKNAIDKKAVLRGTEYSLKLSTVDGSNGMLIADTTYRLTDATLKSFIMSNMLIDDGLKVVFNANVSFEKGAEKYKTYTDPTNGYEENILLKETQMGSLL